MVFIVTCFLCILCDKILFSDGVLLFKNRYERDRINQQFLKNVPLPPKIAKNNFKQKLDHYNPTETRMWEQVYFTEDKFYKRGGPVYLWIEGEWTASSGWFMGGYWQDHGRKHHALFFVVEHRFYGYSQPTGDASTENLRYLSAPQALADLASFIVSMNKKYEIAADTKWIVFGGSYAGNLVAWMRIKYPHLVHGAVASSAPILAQLNFPQYFDVVSDALAAYKERCKTDVALANKKLDKLLQTAKGREEVGGIFKLCEPLRGRKLDMSFFVANMADYFAGTVQYDKKGRYVKKVCEKMLENADNVEPIKRYSNVMNIFIGSYGDSCLYTNYTQYLEYLKKDDAKTSRQTVRPWIYQTCTEFGYYQTLRKKGNTFSRRISLDFYLATCYKVFKPFFNQDFVSQAVEESNTLFGGLNVATSRIVFIHGSLDPWHTSGLFSQPKAKNVSVILIKGASHCSDLSFPSNDDTQEVKDARIEIMKLLESWLKTE